jgi:hemerythrin-like domain-containing protein
MPVVELLAHDHRALERLLTSLGETSGREPEERITLFSHLQTLLQAHARAEEEVVYRPLRARQPEEVKVLEAFEEHHLADILLQELASACPGGAGWAAKLRVLEEILRLHIREEEVQLFALIQSTFDEAARERMGLEFRALKHERVEALLAPLRRATPAFAGRAVVGAQAAAGRYLRRGELYMRQRLGQLRT